MAAAKGWAKGKLIDAEIFTDHRKALLTVDWHNGHSDGRKAKWFKRAVRAGRASVEVTMVVVRMQPEAIKPVVL